ncbi:PREDICTED: golgin subfamily A member 2-like [Dipodomys ordii]|uniref:Golgin subfamily A member 2-like n=1 Tax=Dipodomys ordii TaxID=10020 RepID=A0A1S3GWG4_DIPOR|nr:PREDICTED: golgin subfamily A member 2-like [Dipodomys ordii]
MKMQIHNFQEALVEQAELESQLHNMKELVARLKVERDTFAEDLRLESSTGKEKVQQLLDKLVELREQLSELRPPQPPAGPAQAEQQLQVEENQSLSLQNLEQQQWLWILEKKAEEWEQHAEDRRKILETMEKEQETLKRTLVHNCKLKEELANLQDALQRLSAEKGELASILHTKQQEKTTCREDEGLSQEDNKGEEATPHDVTVPEDVDNPQSMWDFYVDALSITEAGRRG